MPITMMDHEAVVYAEQAGRELCDAFHLGGEP